MIFVLLAAAMILVAAASVGIPLWRARLKPQPSTEFANRAVRDARVQELDRDLSAGRLAAEDYAAARRDLDAELDASLRDLRHFRARASQVRGNRLTAILAAVLVASVAGLLYWQLGNWRPALEGVHAASVFKVEQLVAQLAHRLNTTDQNDLQGWIMLGRSYGLMGRYQDALRAFEHARILSHDQNAEALAGYAEVLTLSDPAQLTKAAAPLFEAVLKLDPENAQGLWYGGLIAYARGDRHLAMQHWQSLLAQNPPKNFRAAIQAQIAQANGPAALPGPADADAQAIAASTKGVAVQVSLDPALRDKVSASETVFVFAEPAGQDRGPPLAVRRFQVRDLPLQITLSDADSMLSNRKLSDFSDVTIIARISLRDTPLPQAGDLMGQTRWQAGMEVPAHIRISQILP